MQTNKLLRLVGALEDLAGVRRISTSNSRSSEKGGFFSSLLKPVEVQSASHSNKLSDKDLIYELTTHNVKPDSLAKYLKGTENLIGFVNSNQDVLHGECYGNFKVIVGDQDQFVHLWRYEGGYENIDQNIKFLSQSPDFAAIEKDIVSCLRSRHSQHMLKFSYWPEIQIRTGKNIYEMRSYHLKPGTMVEWGNYWAKAIRMRDYGHTEAYTGMFSQIGELYNVKHVWCYGSMEERRQARESVWQTQSQWQEIVANTVPLIRKMTSRIMVPLELSSTK